MTKAFEETEHPDIVCVDGKYIWRKDLFEFWDDIQVISQDEYVQIVEDWHDAQYT